MARFFMAGTNIQGGMAIIRGRDAEHVRVLRLRPGEDVIICDGEGTDYKCRLVYADKEQAHKPQCKFNEEGDFILYADADNAPAEPQRTKKADLNWNSYDFVAGDEIIFEDLVEGEKVGEFPSHWDLMDGYAEIATIQGRKVIKQGFFLLFLRNVVSKFDTLILTTRKR